MNVGKWTVSMEKSWKDHCWYTKRDSIKPIVERGKQFCKSQFRNSINENIVGILVYTYQPLFNWSFHEEFLLRFLSRWSLTPFFLTSWFEMSSSTFCLHTETFSSATSVSYPTLFGLSVLTKRWRDEKILML